MSDENGEKNNKLFTKLIVLLATGFGSGRAARAPGTFGTLPAIPLAYIFAHCGDLFYLGMTMSLVFVAILVAQAYERFSDKHDPKEIVIDEIVGYLVAFALLPAHWFWFLAAFGLFRFFDALKPFPINVVDRKIKGGLGVVADDLLAGIFTNLILQIVYQNGWLSQWV